MTSTLCVLEHLDDVDGLGVGDLDGLGVVLADAVERRAALHDDVGRRHVGDLDGVVLGGEDGLGEVEADLLGVHVERGDELHVAHVVPAELDVHQAGHGGVLVGVLVVLHALHQRGRAVAHADDGDPDVSACGHDDFSSCPTSMLFRYYFCGALVDVLTWFGVSLRGLLRRDQLVEPLDFPLAGLQPQLVQLTGVAVERVAGPRDCFTQTFATFLHLTTAAFQNPHPRLGGRAVEEGEVHAEAVVGEVLRPGVGHQLGEPLLAGVGELVDAARPAHLDGALGCGVLDDQAVGLHAAQRRVQRAVRERPERAEEARQAFAQLVAVHRGFEEKTQDGQLQHPGHLLANSSVAVTAQHRAQCIAPIYSHTIAPIYIPATSAHAKGARRECPAVSCWGS